MDLSPGGIFASLLLGAVGTGLFVYGKKQARLPPLVAGVVLIAVPAFVSAAWSAVIGVAVVGALWLGTRAGIF